MPTPAQISANQANAQHSTGPKTEAGKAACALNNFRHGLAGLFSVLPSEDAAQYQALTEALRQEHQPATASELILVEKLAQHFWLSQRAQRLADQAADETKFSVLLRYQSTHDRNFHKCLEQLAKLRAEKRKIEIGFESQKRKDAEETRKQEMHQARLRLINAKASHVEIDSEIRQTVEAPLPGHMRIPFETLKDTFQLAVDEANRQLRAQPAA